MCVQTVRLRSGPYSIYLYGQTVHMSHSTTKPIKWPMRPTKTLIRLGIRPVWSVFAVFMKKGWTLSYPLSAQQRFWSDWVDADPSLFWAHSQFVGFVVLWLMVGPYEYILMQSDFHTVLTWTKQKLGGELKMILIWNISRTKRQQSLDSVLHHALVLISSCTCEFNVQCIKIYFSFETRKTLKNTIQTSLTTHKVKAQNTTTTAIVLRFWVLRIFLYYSRWVGYVGSCIPSLPRFCRYCGPMWHHSVVTL